ncbi:MAG TPA: hypothetical protein PKW52_10640 [Nitrospira sp.]|nr:hypothetical protein [Nitrospira sp.]HQV11790.1 hypothetical protein [Nitrospira sp.]
MMAAYTSSGCRGLSVWHATGCCGGWHPALVPGPLHHLGFHGGMASAGIVVVLEAVADSTTTTKKVFIGGTSPVRLTLEYVPDDGATAPSVALTVVEGGSSTSTWKETTITPGYHVKSEWVSVAPGSLVTLEVAEASARLRWCETVCC